MWCVSRASPVLAAGRCTVNASLRLHAIPCRYAATSPAEAAHVDGNMTQRSPLSAPHRGLPHGLAEEAEKDKPVVKPSLQAEGTSKRSSVSEKIQNRAQKKAVLTLVCGARLALLTAQTPGAVERLRAMRSDSVNPRTIRVTVRNKGCAGMSYHLEYIKPDDKGRFDERVLQDGVELLVDSRALFRYVAGMCATDASIIGSEMDWKEDKLCVGARWHTDPPDQRNLCSTTPMCGTSAAVASRL